MAPTSKSLGGGMPFIVSTGTKKPDPEMRKFIRSHVMIGKNRGKILRPKNKKAKESNSPEDTRDVRSSSDEEHVSGSLVSSSLRNIPKKVGSDLSLIRFADTIDDSSVAVILEFSTIAKKALFPLESCISFGAKETEWVEALTRDAAYLHAMAFSTQAYFDLLPGRTAHSSSAVAYPHMLKTLRLLRERLEAPEEAGISKASFSTAAVVLCLAFHAHMVGEYQTARHHMQGLRKIVDLKGGLVNLGGNSKLIIELLRCDISISMHSGSKPLFFADPVREPYWPFPDFSEYGVLPSVEDEPFLGRVDSELAIAWRTMKQFSTLVNRAADARHKLPKDHLLDAMASITYRLLHMGSPRRFARGSLEDAVRLGLLAFCTTVFLQWADVRLPYAYFPAAYRDCLVNLQFPVPGDSDSDSGVADVDADGRSSTPRLLLWLLTIGAVSVFGEGDGEAWLRPWLRVNIELCGVSSWPAMRAVLDSFMWVGLVHDAPGKALFDLTTSSGLYLGYHE